MPDLRRWSFWSVVAIGVIAVGLGWREVQDYRARLAALRAEVWKSLAVDVNGDGETDAVTIHVVGHDRVLVEAWDRGIGERLWSTWEGPPVRKSFHQHTFTTTDGMLIGLFGAEEWRDLWVLGWRLSDGALLWERRLPTSEIPLLGGLAPAGPDVLALTWERSSGMTVLRTLVASTGEERSVARWQMQPAVLAPPVAVNGGTWVAAMGEAVLVPTGGVAERVDDTGGLPWRIDGRTCVQVAQQLLCWDGQALAPVASLPESVVALGSSMIVYEDRAVGVSRLVARRRADDTEAWSYPLDGILHSAAHDHGPDTAVFHELDAPFAVLHERFVESKYEDFPGTSRIRVVEVETGRLAWESLPFPSDSIVAWFRSDRRVIAVLDGPRPTLAWIDLDTGAWAGAVAVEGIGRASLPIDSLNVDGERALFPPGTFRCVVDLGSGEALGCNTDEIALIDGRQALESVVGP